MRKQTQIATNGEKMNNKDKNPTARNIAPYMKSAPYQKTPKGLLPEDKVIYETIALWRAEEGLPTIKERH